MTKEDKNRNIVTGQGGRIDLDNFYDLSFVKKHLVSLVSRIGCRSAVEGILSTEPKKETIYHLSPLFPPVKR